MKKKIIFAALATIVVAASAFTVVKSERSSLGELFNANVEALTRDESGTGTCYNTITTASGQKVLYCETCTYISGKPSWISGTGTCGE